MSGRYFLPCVTYQATILYYPFTIVQINKLSVDELMITFYFLLIESSLNLTRSPWWQLFAMSFSWFRSRMLPHFFQ